MKSSKDLHTENVLETHLFFIVYVISVHVRLFVSSPFCTKIKEQRLPKGFHGLFEKKFLMAVGLNSGLHGCLF
jgi:hypothetical protein